MLYIVFILVFLLGVYVGYEIKDFTK